MDLNELIDKTVNGLGFEVVDIEQSPRGRILRVFIDKPGKEGGIDVDDCALVSNQLGDGCTLIGAQRDIGVVAAPR